MQQKSEFLGVSATHWHTQQMHMQNCGLKLCHPFYTKYLCALF